MAADKLTALRALREERDRRLAIAMAGVAASMPFAPPQRGAFAAGSGTSDEKHEPIDGPAGSKRPDEAQPLPEFIASKAQDATETLRQAALRANREVFGKEIAETAPPALLILALVAIIVVPAAGVALLLLGIAHLRGHSFVKGSLLILIGALTVWATYAVASSVNPHLLRRAQTSDSKGNWNANARD
jgi:hypothetical protein